MVKVAKSQEASLVYLGSAQKDMMAMLERLDKTPQRGGGGWGGRGGMGGRPAVS